MISVHKVSASPAHPLVGLWLSSQVAGSGYVQLVSGQLNNKGFLLVLFSVLVVLIPMKRAVVMPIVALRNPRSWMTAAVSRKSRYLFGPEGKFWNQNYLNSSKLPSSLTANFASLTDSFNASLSKLLKLWSWTQTRQTQNSFSGSEKLAGRSRNGPPGLTPQPKRFLLFRYKKWRICFWFFGWHCGPWIYRYDHEWYLHMGWGGSGNTWRKAKAFSAFVARK